MLHSSGNSRWSPFYNLTTFGSYHFQLQQVVLDCINAPLLTALEKQLPAARLKILSLASHEYTHWRDNVATLWGRRLLSQFYEGVAARLSNDPNNFYQIVKAKRSIIRCANRKYYFTPGPKKGASPPWTWRLSVGLAFDGSGKLNKRDPIPFIKFYIPPGADEPNMIVRMPISAASLAEVRAMHAEYHWIAQERAVLGKDGTPADPEDWLHKYDRQTYEENYLEYTTALHLLVNQCGRNNVQGILGHASALAGVALNYPSALISRLVIPNEWQKFWGTNAETGDRISFLLADRNPGFLYSLLCTYANAPDKEQPIDHWIDNILQSAGKLNLDEFELAWRKELNANELHIHHPFMKMWIEGGLPWALASGPTAPPDVLIDVLNGKKDSLSLPGAYTGDLAIWQPTSPSSFGDERLTIARIEELEAIEKMLNEFCDVCGM